MKRISGIASRPLTNSPLHLAAGSIALMLLLLATSGCASKSTQSAQVPPHQTYGSAKVVSATKVSKPTKVARPPKGTNVVNTARSLIGSPYQWGGRSPRTGFDCSGFVWYVFNQYGVDLPRTSSDFLTVGSPVNKSEIRPGDILIYNINSKRKSLHAAIATGRGSFIHSPSSGKTVCEVSMSEPYWRGRLLEVRRII